MNEVVENFERSLPPQNRLLGWDFLGDYDEFCVDIIL